MLQIKAVDAASAALADHTVKVSGTGALQSSVEGMAQFRIEIDAALDIDVNGASVWSGNSTELARDEMFKADGASFGRVKAG